MSGNSPSRMGVREVGVLLNESAQADAVGRGRPVEGIPVVHDGEDVNGNRMELVPPVPDLARLRSLDITAQALRSVATATA